MAKALIIAAMLALAGADAAAATQSPATVGELLDSGGKQLTGGEIASAGGSTQLTGTWSANQSNQYCQDLRTAQGMPILGCFYYFTIGNRLFMATANDRSTPILERQVTR